MTESKGFSKNTKMIGLVLGAIIFALICHSPEMGKDAPDYAASALRFGIIGAILGFFIWMGKMSLKLHWKIIIGLVIGIGFALLSSAMAWSAFTLD